MTHLNVGDRVRLIDYSSSNGYGYKNGDEGFVEHVEAPSDNTNGPLVHVKMDDGGMHRCYGHRFLKVEPPIAKSEPTLWWVRVKGPNLTNSQWFQSTEEHSVDDLANIVIDHLAGSLTIVSAEYDLQARGSFPSRHVRSRTTTYPRGAWTSVAHFLIVPKEAS